LPLISVESSKPSNDPGISPLSSFPFLLSLSLSRDVFLADSLDEETLLSMTGSWNKFSALIELLECNLSDISEWLPKYGFSSPPSLSC
jgi:hypothetical protein